LTLFFGYFLLGQRSDSKESHAPRRALNAKRQASRAKELPPAEGENPYPKKNILKLKKSGAG